MSDLKGYFALISVPAAVLTVVGLALLRQQGALERATAAEADRGRAEQLAGELQEQLRDLPAAERDDFLSGWSIPGAPAPAARFRWTPADRATPLSEPLRTDLADALAPLARWNSWISPGRRSARRGLMPVGPYHVLWARVDDAIYAAAFAETPLAPSPVFPLWPAGLVMATLLAGLVATGGALLWRAAEKARRDDREKSGFVDNVSHELKSPLAAMRVWSDLLRKERQLSPEQTRRAHAAIDAETDRMLRLVDDLLDLARLERGRRRGTVAEADLSLLARELVETLRPDFPRGLALAVPNGPVRMRTEPDAVRQILRNLLDNARKYAAADGEVTLTATPRGTGGAVLTVADRGPGLSDESLRHCFERFYRERDGQSANVPGLGIGLAISRALARQLGGSLNAARREGGGAVFTLALADLDGEDAT